MLCYPLKHSYPLIGNSDTQQGKGGRLATIASHFIFVRSSHDSPRSTHLEIPTMNYNSHSVINDATTKIQRKHSRGRVGSAGMFQVYIVGEAAATVWCGESAQASAVTTPASFSEPTCNLLWPTTPPYVSVKTPNG
jgi:hypothetical protein